MDLPCARPIETLPYVHTGWDETEPNELDKILKHGPINGTLRHLDLSRSSRVSVVPVCRLLAMFSNLHEVDLSHSRFDATALRSLLGGLDGNTALQSLALNDCMLGDHGASLLFSVVASRPLTSLGASYNDFTNEGFGHLVRVLHWCHCHVLH